jgi:hypothetical protein
VTFTALDSITGVPVPSAADTVRVTTVARPSLSISASVTAPADAIDRKVGIGAGFTVTAMVANAAGAAGIAAPGSLTINLPPGYARAPGEAQVKPFVIGASVTWNLIAAAQPSGRTRSPSRSPLFPTTKTADSPPPSRRARPT